MKRPYLTYLLTVVVPAVLALVAGWNLARMSWTELGERSGARVGRMVLASFEQKMGQTVDSLAAEAVPLSGPVDRDLPQVTAALTGDTVAGIQLVDGRLELAVFLPDPDDANGVRMASGEVDGSVARTVGRTAGFGAAIYLNGSRWSSTQPPLGPDTISPRMISAAANALPGRGHRLAGYEPAVVLVARDAPSGAAPALTALTQPRNTPDRAVSVEILLVLGLLVLFAVLTGWIQLARPRASHRVSVYSVVALALVPTLTTFGFLSYLDRHFQEAARTTLQRDLGRGLAVADALDVLAGPGAIRAVTGFHAARVAGGAVQATTLPSGAEALAALPAPPASFTSTGSVAMAEGPALYVARRLDRGGMAVATELLPAAMIDGFTYRAFLVGGGLAVWLMLVGMVLVLKGDAPRSPSEDDPTRTPS